MPPEWLGDDESLPIMHPRIAYRDVCRATDTRTMLCALVPPNSGLVGGAPYLLRRYGTAKDEAYVLGILSSLPFDWFSRRFVEAHMKHYLVNSFPLPHLDPLSGEAIAASNESMGGPNLLPIRESIVKISGRLGAVDDRYAGWAKEVGVPVGSVERPEEKDALIAELDALVSLLYGLSRGQVEQVFATFHRGWDYKPRLAAVLAHFDAWSASLGEGK